MDKAEKELNFWRHTAIKGVTEDAEKMQFNTAIARLMEFVNALINIFKKKLRIRILKRILVDYIKLLAPFAPHFTEEQWNLLGI